MNIKNISLLLAALATGNAVQAQSNCDARCMTGIAIQYMTDVASQDWSKLPWAERVRYTENNVAMMIGDAVSIGCNAVLAPGTVVGRRTVIYHGATVRGMVPADSIVKLRQPHETVSRDA